MQDNIGSRSQISLFCYVAVSIILLVLGGWLTYIGLGDLYYDLDFPPFQPPSWLFTPAWVIVLSCLALSTWLVTGKVQDNVYAVLLALALYGGQCVLNAGWSLLLLPYAAWLLLSTAIKNWIVMHNTFPLLRRSTL